MIFAPRSAVILIVEDDPNGVLFLRALKIADVRQAVRIARDGREAIDYLSGMGEFEDRERYPLPCLIVLDIRLPKTNGLEVLEWLRHRKEFQDMPIVMVTSSGEISDKETALRPGVDAYRVKPVSLEELVLIAGDIRIEAQDHFKDPQP